MAKCLWQTFRQLLLSPRPRDTNGKYRQYAWGSEGSDNGVANHLAVADGVDPLLQALLGDGTLLGLHDVTRWVSSRSRLVVPVEVDEALFDAVEGVLHLLVAFLQVGNSAKSAIRRFL